MSGIQGRKIVMILANQNFRDEEFTEPHELLKDAGAEMKVACSKKGTAKGMLGHMVTPDLLIRDVAVTNFDCVIFIGGGGAQEHFNDPAAHRIAKEAILGNKVLGAICIAPATLANAGVLRGRKATCFPSVENVMKRGGALIEKRDVVTDGMIVTANGPEAATEFARSIAALLQ
jgi:protease I